MNVQNFYLTIIAVTLASSMWCFGFQAIITKVVFEEILDIDLDYDWDHLDRWQKLLFKPLFACPYCMASVHGSIIFFVFLLPLLGFWGWIPFCVCLCGLNYVITQFFTE